MGDVSPITDGEEKPKGVKQLQSKSIINQVFGRGFRKYLGLPEIDSTREVRIHTTGYH